MQNFDEEINDVNDVIQNHAIHLASRVCQIDFSYFQ